MQIVLVKVEMFMRVLIFVCVWTIIISWCEGSYENLYGGVVAQSIPNIAESDPDVSEAVAFALRQANLYEEDCRMTYIDKQRLYFSKDNHVPFLKNTFEGGHGPGGAKPSIQKRQSVLGLLYSFQLLCHPRGEEGNEEHCLVVTRDRNKDFHLFKKTSKKASMPLTCRSVDESPWSKLVPAFASSFNSSSPESGLRIASYNIWNVNSLNHKGETYERRMKRLGKLVNSLGPDVIGFQEVRLEVGSRNTGHGKGLQPTLSQPTFLAGALDNYQFVFQPAMLYMERPLERKEEGIAIFSRYPIISSSYRLLSRNSSDSEDYHQRICLHAEVLTPQFGSIHVFVSHLSLSAASQERTVVEIWKYMQEFSGVKLLLGDLNAEPQARAMRFLRGEIVLFGEQTRQLVDLWQLEEIKSERQDQGFTFNALDEELVKRIDYIFASFPQDQHIQVGETSVTVDKHICTRPCSDHHMIQTTLISEQQQCLI